jgi:hypothetical protein
MSSEVRRRGSLSKRSWREFGEASARGEGVGSLIDEVLEVEVLGLDARARAGVLGGDQSFFDSSSEAVDDGSDSLGNSNGMSVGGSEPVEVVGVEPDVGSDKRGVFSLWHEGSRE